MQGQSLQLRKLFSWLSLIWICLLSFPVTAADESVLIIKSHENQFYNQSIEKLINKTEHKVKFNIVTARAYEKNHQDYNPDIIITLGTKAAELSNEIKKDAPLIHSYITEFQLNHHGREGRHYSVLLDQPFERYLRFIQLLLPVNKVGIIKTENNKFSSRTIQRAEKSTGLKVDQYIFNPEDNPITRVRNILQTDDVLLSLPEPAIYNHQTLKGILLSSYRLNKPVVSYSPAHVKSGALAAIYISPVQIGEQIADTLNQLLSGSLEKQNQEFYAQGFQIKINRQVAYSLQIALPSDQSIMQQLQSGESQ